MDNKIRYASAIIGNDQYKTELITDSHTLIGDEPIDNGGKDLGPSPGDFIRMSLASCTAITLRMYANRKGFDVQRIEVKVNTETVENTTIFRAEVILDGNLDTEQKARMLKVARACPVHKLLTNPIQVETKLV